MECEFGHAKTVYDKIPISCCLLNNIYANTGICGTSKNHFKIFIHIHIPIQWSGSTANVEIVTCQTVFLDT